MNQTPNSPHNTNHTSNNYISLQPYSEVLEQVKDLPKELWVGEAEARLKPSHEK